VKPLDDYTIPEPCDVAWETMTTVDGVPARHCSTCSHRVYDFERMSRAEIARLLSESVSVCAIAPRHEDGVLITRDRPQRRNRLRVLSTMTAGAAALAGLAGCPRAEPTERAAPIGTVMIDPPPQPPPAPPAPMTASVPSEPVTSASVPAAPVVPSVKKPPAQTAPRPGKVAPPLSTPMGRFRG
jgi:hypothetical protein